MDYLAWNDAIARVFFCPENAGKQVYLFATEELIEAIACDNDCLRSDLVRSANVGPPWAARQGFCQKAILTAARWRRRPGLLFPPYIGYLAICVLAAGLDGDFEAREYYPRLRKTLGLPGEGTLSWFDRMDELWADLEVWSLEREGQLGSFRARSVGGKIHIGYPLSQTILTERERSALPSIFFAADLDPTAPAPRGELARRIVAAGREHLRPRTTTALTSGQDRNLREALLDAIYDELAEWTGSDQEGEPPDTGRVAARIRSGLRLCMDLDVVVGRSDLKMRARLFNRDFPEDVDELRLSGGIQAICSQAFGGWSTVLQTADDGGPCHPTARHLEHGLTLQESVLGWHLRLPPSDVRLLVDGTAEELPGLVEVYSFPATPRTYILATDRAWSVLGPWFESGGPHQRFDNLRGLPDGWSLGLISNPATVPTRLKEQYPCLDSPSQARIRFVGGIRADATSGYFSFARPRVVVEGASEPLKLRCGGFEFERLPGRDDYELPAELPVEERLWVEVSADETRVRRRAMVLVQDTSWHIPSTPPRLDSCGRPSDDDAAYSGLLVATPIGHEFQWALPISTGTARVMLVGRVPGQVHLLPSRLLPDWDPVWAVPLAKKRQVVYCGHDPDKEEPDLSSPSSIEHRKTEAWKDILWQRRKRIREPGPGILKTLWRDYVEAARNA